MMWLIRVSVPSVELKLLREVNIHYDGLVIDLNVAAYFDKCVRQAPRLASLVAIDPNLTFLTCKPLSDIVVEKTLRALGILPYVRDRSRPLSVDELRDSELETIAKNVLTLQRSIVEPQSLTLEQLLGIEAEPSRPRARYLLMAPYFVVSRPTDPEYRINLKLLEYAVRYKRQGEELYAVIAIDKTLLYDPQAVNKIISDYARYSNDVDGYAVWVVDFEEVSEDEDALYNLILFLDKLKQRTGKPILNLYGDYFSALLSKLSLLDGIVTRICLRQRRARCPKGGGPPRENYYLSIVKAKVSAASIAYIPHLERLGFSVRCNCPTCSQKLDDMISTIEKTGTIPITYLDDLKKHYLYAFEKELQHIENSSLEQLLKELEDSYNQLESLGVMELLGQGENLLRWYSVIARYIHERSS